MPLPSFVRPRQVIVPKSQVVDTPQARTVAQSKTPSALLTPQWWELTRVAPRARKGDVLPYLHKARG